MTKRFYVLLAHIAIPIMIQELINSFVNILDTFMIGTVGVNEITAVGLANQVFFLFILLTYGITSGSGIIMGQYWGAEDLPSIKKTLGICLVFSFFSACIFAGAALFAPKIIMGIYSKDPRVIEIGADYLGTIWISYILVAMSMSLSASLKSTRQTKIPMFTTMIALCCNAVLNYVFIFILKWGVIGAARATVIARLVELSLLLAIIYGNKMPTAAKISELFKGDRAFLKAFLIVTVPVVLNESIWAFGTSVYNIAYKYCGTEAQGAFHIASSVQTLFMVVGMSLGFASGIITSNSLGAGEIDEAITNSRRFIKLAVGSGIVMGALLFICSPLIVNIFNVSGEVKMAAVKIMYVIAIVSVAKTVSMITIVGILRSGGDTWFCFLLDGISVWCIGIPCAFLGAVILKLPIYYVVAMVSLEEVLKVFVGVRRVLKNGWARKIV